MSVNDHLTDLAREKAIVEMQGMRYQAEKRAEAAEEKLEKMRVAFLKEIERSEVTSSKILALKDDVKHAELVMINMSYALDGIMNTHHKDTLRPNASLREQDILDNEITKLLRCKRGIECECFKN
jgi:predicted transcriptional regulator